MPTIDLPSGTIHYRIAGPEIAEAPPVVFVHAFLLNGGVWSGVAERLAARGVRSYAPDWPLGAHRTPVKSDADQSPRGVARQIAAFLEALDLDDVTLVGSDTGGALIQFLLDTDPSRVGRVVLANCDAFDSFPPFPFTIVFQLLNGTRRMKANLMPLRSRAIRHSPIGFGLLANNLDAAQTREWIEPALASKEIRRDAVRFLHAAEPSELLDVSTRLKDFKGPVRIVWGMQDSAFKPALGRRLRAAFSNAEFVEVPGARTLVQLDAPDVLAEQIIQIAKA